MRKHLILTCLTMGLLTTVLTARLDDALELVGRLRVSPPEIAADANSFMVRQLGISSREIWRSQPASEIASPSAVLRKASAAKWRPYPLAGIDSANWTGPVKHQVVFGQGWPLDAFAAALTPGGEITGGVVFGPPRTRHVVAFMPVWSGLLGNTLLYATVFWLIIVLIELGRRALRRRAGLCVQCSYTKRGIPEGAPCPECGST